MRKIAKTVEVVHTHTHTQGNLINKGSKTKIKILSIISDVKYIDDG